MSKWNSHLPSVIMVMTHNGPFFPKALKKKLFVKRPTDVRSSRFAHFMAAFGHVSEFIIPFMEEDTGWGLAVEVGSKKRHGVLGLGYYELEGDALHAVSDTNADRVRLQTDIVVKF